MQILLMKNERNKCFSSSKINDNFYIGNHLTLYFRLCFAIIICFHRSFVQNIRFRGQNYKKYSTNTNRSPLQTYPQACQRAD